MNLSRFRVIRTRDRTRIHQRFFRDDIIRNIGAISSKGIDQFFPERFRHQGKVRQDFTNFSKISTVVFSYDSIVDKWITQRSRSLYHTSRTIILRNRRLRTLRDQVNTLVVLTERVFGNRSHVILTDQWFVMCNVSEQFERGRVFDHFGDHVVRAKCIVTIRGIGVNRPFGRRIFLWVDRRSFYFVDGGAFLNGVRASSELRIVASLGSEWLVVERP